MARTRELRFVPKQLRYFGRDEKHAFGYPVPCLTDIQRKSYEAFLQVDVPPEKRKNQGLEAVLREIFPIVSYDGSMRLEYVRYELGEPRYDPDECRQLRLTYGRPFRLWLRLVKGDESIEEDVYLGDLPIMVGGGEFIINGAERVVVSQLHRSPGVDFLLETEAGDRKFFSCRIIPERGSWIEVQVTRRETLHVRIDQSGRFSAMTLLRAMDPEHSTDEQILRKFYEVKTISTRDIRCIERLENQIPCGDVIDPGSGEILAESCEPISREKAEKIVQSSLKEVLVLDGVDDPLVLNSCREDPSGRCCAFTSDSARATRRSWPRPRSCSTRSFSIRTATGSAGSAGSASTGNSSRTCPRQR